MGWIANDYECSGCGVTTEELHKAPVPGSIACPACGGQAVKIVSCGYKNPRAKSPGAWDDNPAWIEADGGVSESLQLPEDIKHGKEERISSRSGLKAYCEKHGFTQLG